MKKLLLTVAAVLGMSAMSQAQELTYGVKAGLNLSDLNGDVEDTSMRTSFHVGGFASYEMSDKLAFQADLLYSQQGATGEESIFGIDGKEELRLAYLTLPVFAKYYLFDGFNIQAGPQFSYLLSAKDEYEYSYMGYSTSGEEDVKDNLNSLDLGAVLGAAYELENGLSFGARYSLGFSNILKDNDDVKASNGVIQVSVAYNLNSLFE